MRKRILAAVLCMVVIFGAVQPLASAATLWEGGENQIQWVNTQSIILAMSYSGGNVSWTGQILGNANTTKITATYKLEKKDANGKWVPVGSWPVSTTSTYLISTGSATTPIGTFKLTVTGTVTSKTGYAEPISSVLEKSFA